MILTGVHGAAGRMGRQNLAAVLGAPDLRLAAAVEHAGHPLLGSSVRTWLGPAAPPDLAVALSADLGPALEAADVFIDFSHPDACVRLAEEAARRKKALVIGTTGLDAAQTDALRRAARTVPIVASGNFSLGVNVLLALVEQAARLLEGSDIEIVEHHHNQKKDAPSGTALMLARAAAAGRDLDPVTSLVHGRDGQVGARTKDEIGMHAVRGGGIVGYHEVFFAGPHETVRLSHQAQAREAFTSGVIAAVRWVYGKAPGLYAMTDVLGLRSLGT